MGMSEPQTELRRLQEALDVASRLAADIVASQTGVEAIRHLAEVARERLRARYGAVGVATEDGAGLETFITVGLTSEQEKAIGERPRGAGVLGLLLSRTEPLRLDDLSQHPASAGFPPHHPPMTSFLGVPIRHGKRVLGSLYLTEKPGGFTPTDEATVSALSLFFGVAIRNHQLLRRQRALMAGILSAQEDERRAIAYDLHDGLTQYVMAAHAQFDTYRALLAEGKAERATLRLEAGMKYLKDAVVESRRLVSGLRTLALDDLGLVGAVEQLLSEEEERCGWDEARLDESLGTKRLTLGRETAAFRIVQEALTNVRKHARARRVTVALHREGDWLTLTVADDGIGFDVAVSTPQAGHIGLHGMAERARLLGGELQVRSAAGQGTTIRVRLPMTEEGTSDGG
jgi:signal transduction histidine kinase